MHHEVEQKFPVADAASLVASLTLQGAAWRDPIEQVDTYFAHPSRDFAQTDEALRIRRVGNENFVTYKGPKLDALTKTRRELEFLLATGPMRHEQFGELLEALGFRRVADVRKVRRPGTLHWSGQPVELALDEVDGVGTYFEAELSANEGELDRARQALLDLARVLALPPPERRSYLELLLTSGGR